MMRMPFADRIIRKARVKCSMQLKQSNDKDEEDQDDVLGLDNIECKWKGQLGDLREHLENNCILAPVECKHCDEEFKRYEIKQHEEKCPEREVECPFGKYGCDEMVKLKHFDDHLRDEKINHLELKVNHIFFIFLIDYPYFSHKMLFFLHTKGYFYGTKDAKHGEETTEYFFHCNDAKIW